MTSLREYIADAESRKIAIGHFNISDLVGFKAIVDAARELGMPVVIGVSEGERNFIGVRQVARLAQSTREEGLPIFLNADHTHSLEEAKKAIDAGFNAVLFDGSKLSIAENIMKTKEVAEYARKINPEILIEGELGYIGSGSTMLAEIPADVSLREEDLTQNDQAAHFAKETGVDLFSPAVGNLHGMLKNQPNPKIHIDRIAQLRSAAGVPLVLHGGSGIRDEEFIEAIDAGVSVVHINTELRLAWRRGFEAALREQPDEIVPYKVLPRVVTEVQAVVAARMRLFGKIR